MRKFTCISIFYVILLSLSFNNLVAQKASIKTITQQKYLRNEVGDLKLTQQVQQHFNRFHHMIKEEFYSPIPNYAAQQNNLKMDKKIVYSFDTRGRQLGAMEYNGDNILESESKIYWDEKDNRSKVEEIKYANGEQTHTNTTYLLEYDALGNKKREIYYTVEGIQEQSKEWFYNKNEEVIKTLQIIEKKNQPIKKNIAKFKRNKTGDLTKATLIENVNGKEYRKDLQYFNNNQMIRWRKYIGGKFESEFINEYRDSVVIRTTRRNTRKVISLEKAKRQQERRKKKNAKPNKRNSEIWITNSEYDALGNLVISTQSINNKVVFITQYEYDDYGNCEKIVKTNKESGEKDIELIEYDNMGNISRRAFLKNNHIIAEEQYIYEYYPRD